MGPSFLCLINLNKKRFLGHRLQHVHMQMKIRFFGRHRYLLSHSNRFTGIALRSALFAGSDSVRRRFLHLSDLARGFGTSLKIPQVGRLRRHQRRKSHHG